MVVSQPLELPAVFPARMNGQQSMVIVTRVQIKWHPAPAEFSASRIDGGVVDIAAITDVDTHELGANKVLRLTAAGVVTRMHAAAELIDRVRDYVWKPSGDSESP